MTSTTVSTSTVADFQPIIDALIELVKLAPHLPVVESLTSHRFGDGEIWLQGYGLTPEQVQEWGTFLGQYTHREGSDVHVAEGHVADVLVRIVAIEKAQVSA